MSSHLEENIKQTLTNLINKNCSCDFQIFQIDEGEFSCRSGNDGYVTYRWELELKLVMERFLNPQGKTNREQWYTEYTTSACNDQGLDGQWRDVPVHLSWEHETGTGPRLSSWDCLLLPARVCEKDKCEIWAVTHRQHTVVLEQAAREPLKVG